MKKIIYLIIITINILGLTGCKKDSSGVDERPIAEYTIVNSLKDKAIYYETEYILIELLGQDGYEDKYSRPIKQGVIESGKYQELGFTNKQGMDEDGEYTIFYIKIYSDAEHKTLLYSYKKGDEEEAKKIFKYSSGEEFNIADIKNRVIFNMTEDKIIK